jgi:hypothetical protein
VDAGIYQVDFRDKQTQGRVGACFDTANDSRVRVRYLIRRGGSADAGNERNAGQQPDQRPLFV